MALREEFEQAGNRLFRWRSYLPIVVIGPILFLSRGVGPLPSRELFGYAWDGFSLAVSLFGLGIRILTVGFVPSGTSGRNTLRQVADTLNTTGMYSIVRHPLYLGNFFIWLGMLLFGRSCGLGIILILLFCLYYERIMFAEEEFLRRKFGRTFLEWSGKTPAFLPNLKNWRRPAPPFSFRAVLNREYHGLVGILAAASLLAFWREGRLDPFWGWLLATGAIFYILLTLLKKKTKMLSVEGR